MNKNDYVFCAKRIVDSLRLQAGERVLLKLDPRTFSELVEPLQKEIRQAGALVSAVVLAEETTETSELELNLLRRQFEEADVFIWLPERHQGNRPALAQAI